MDVGRVVGELKKKYPRKQIIKNGDPVTEIICEIDPTAEHPEWSAAIAVVEQIAAHYHKKTTEVYEVIKGKLQLNKDGENFKLSEGDVMTINPGEVHFASGNETWIKATSKPGWVIEDHILV